MRRSLSLEAANPDRPVTPRKTGRAADPFSPCSILKQQGQRHNHPHGGCQLFLAETGMRGAPGSQAREAPRSKKTGLVSADPAVVMVTTGPAFVSAGERNLLDTFELAVDRL
jgi:hypothetical protein